MYKIKKRTPIDKRPEKIITNPEIIDGIERIEKLTGEQPKVVLFIDEIGRKYRVNV